MGKSMMLNMLPILLSMWIKHLPLFSFSRKCFFSSWLKLPSKILRHSVSCALAEHCFRRHFCWTLLGEKKKKSRTYNLQTGVRGNNFYYPFLLRWRGMEKKMNKYFLEDCPGEWLYLTISKSCRIIQLLHKYCFLSFMPFILTQLADTVTILDTFLVGSFIPAFKSSFSCWHALFPQAVLWLSVFVKFLWFSVCGIWDTQEFHLDA